MTVDQDRQQWLIAGISLLFLLVLAMFLYQHTLLYLTGLWNRFHNGEYGHGYLVLAIAAFIIVRNRRQLSTITPCPSYKGLLAVLASALLWFAAALVDVNMMEAVSLLLLVLSLVWVILGAEVAKALLFPLLFIGFALPIWFPLSPLLQDLTANTVFWFIRMLKVPAFLQENMIIVPAGTLSVEEACSGLRYLLAALTLGALYAYLNFHTTISRLLVVIISAAVAVLTNIVRVFIVVYLGYTTDMQHPFVQDHLMLGWYLFGGFVVVLLFIDARLYKYYRPAESIAGKDSITQPSRLCNKDNIHYFPVLLIAALFMSAAPAAITGINYQSNAAELRSHMSMPVAAGDWNYSNTGSDEWKPNYNGAVDHKQIYQKANLQIVLYVGYYPEQVQGKELINDLNRISDDEIWPARYTRAKSVQIQDHRVLEQLLENNSGQQRLVWYWYHVAGRVTTNEYIAKALQVLGYMTGKRQASVIAVAANIDTTADQARHNLAEFITEMKPSEVMGQAGE